MLARLGGDEFAVILRDVDDPAVADEVGRKILDVVGAPFTLRGSAQVIGASVGVALAPLHGTDPHGLLHCAELAMRSAKDAHVGVEVYRRSLEARAADRPTLADDLRRALAEDAIDVVYQPQVALYDGRTVGIEALARWNHPERGPIPTERFVRLAEDVGLVGQLDQAVLARALGDLASLHAADHAIQLAVNLSARDLADPRLAERVAAATAHAGIDARHLTVELTESTVMRDPAHDGAILRRLRDAGACVAIDDFGTGYSSLAYLSELPVAELKIDRAFVRGAADGLRDRAIVRSIASLGRELGLRVCAEGVEDAQAWELVRELGCSTAQGTTSRARCRSTSCAAGSGPACAGTPERARQPAAARPARRPKTQMSSRELPIMRFLPCTPPVISPAASTPGTVVAPSASITRPPFW